MKHAATMVVFEEAIILNTQRTNRDELSTPTFLHGREYLVVRFNFEAQALF